MSVADQERGGKVARSIGSAWGFVLLVLVASRFFYLFAGALLASVVLISPLQSQTSIFSLGTLSIWANFDGEHYVGVAESGYEEESPAFFPLYPLLVRSAALFGGPISPGRSPFAGSSFPLPPSASRSTSSTG